MVFRSACILAPTSTHHDITDALLAFGIQPVPLDTWPNMRKAALEATLRQVNRADLFVGVFGVDAGPTGYRTDALIAEQLYEGAAGKPRLCITLNEPGPRTEAYTRFTTETLVDACTASESPEIDLLRLLSGHVRNTPLTVGTHRLRLLTQPVPKAEDRAKLTLFLQDDAGKSEDLVSALCKHLSIDRSDVTHVQQTADASMLQLTLPSAAAKRLHLQTDPYVQELLAAATRAASESELSDEIMREMAHELRTPLLQIKSAAALMEEINKQDILDDLLVMLNGAAARLDSDLRTYLDVTRVMRASHMPQIAVDSNEVVEVTVLDLNEAAIERDITVRFVPQKNMPDIPVSTHLLRRTVRDIVSNAVRFSQTNTVIEVRTAYAGRTLKLEITDPGLSLTPEMFSRFYKIQSRRSNGASRFLEDLLALHGGTITSEALGASGTIIRVTIPV